jgi:hypothetical protein
MSVRVYAPNFEWFRGTNPEAAGALDKALRAWEGTPYESGQRFMQRGCDCIGGVFGVVDMVDGRDRAAFPNMPQDSSMHDRVGAIKAVRELIRRYAPLHKVEPREDGVFVVEPGDLVVTGTPGGGPGHVEIVGARKNELWHALPRVGFHKGGWSLLDMQVLYAIYRLEDKERWGR